MDCPICLTNFDSDSALIPELNCSCLFVVHEECWNNWTKKCLYCRNQPGFLTAQPIRLNRESLYFKIKFSIFVCVIYFTFVFCAFPTKVK